MLSTLRPGLLCLEMLLSRIFNRVIAHGISRPAAGCNGLLPIKCPASTASHCSTLRQIIDAERIGGSAAEEAPEKKKSGLCARWGWRARGAVLRAQLFCSLFDSCPFFCSLASLISQSSRRRRCCFLASEPVSSPISWITRLCHVNDVWGGFRC